MTLTTTLSDVQVQETLLNVVLAAHAFGEKKTSYDVAVIFSFEPLLDPFQKRKRIK